VRVMPDRPPQPTAPLVSAARALELIADAGAVLSSSLDYEQTLRQVARLPVPEVADWCAVYLDGDETEITSEHPDPEVEELILRIRRRRRQIDGASESRRVAETAQPLLASDVRDAFVAEVEDGDLPVIERLDARSYMLVPLVARGRSLGSLTLLSTREGRHYTRQDVAFAETLAARCALAIDNARLHDAAERSLSLLDSIFATAPVGLAFLDTELRFVRVNETMAAFNHQPVDAHIGRTLSEVAGDSAIELTDLYRQVLETGRPVHDLQLSAGGRHYQVFCTPVHGPGGDLLGASGVALDVTERQRLFDAEREGRVRADFLARAGELLDETLDYQLTLRAVADIAVPEVADWCAVSVLDDEGELRQVAAAHVDPEQRELGEELNRRFPADREGATYVVARTGATQVVREITDEMLAAGIPEPERLDLVRRLGLRSIIVAPLRAHGRIFGTLTLANTTGSRLFESADVQLAEDLARRAGTAIENARLYTERTRIAHTLQMRLLPERLPSIPGVVLAARYRAAGELNEVGGDFYDVFARSPDEWALVVGDVTGKGAEAAAITALARYTLRAGALEDDEPAKALQRLNGAMRAHDSPDQYATAVLAYLSAPTPDELRIRLALAGHPPGMAIRADGTIAPVGRHGTMLGVVAEPDFPQTELTLGAGDVLLFYTDGVTEAGPRDRQFGENDFPELLATLAGAPPEAVVDAVEGAVVDLQAGRPRDDIALLALARVPSAERGDAT
jgi:serine phosphatase RsbU (regulator of sigma subunit)/PAS domain-containing protein